MRSITTMMLDERPFDVVLAPHVEEQMEALDVAAFEIADLLRPLGHSLPQLEGKSVMLTDTAEHLTLTLWITSSRVLVTHVAREVRQFFANNGRWTESSEKGKT